MFKNWKYCLYWKCMHTVGEPVAQTLFCRTGFLLTTRSLYIALTQQNLLLVSNGCLPIHLQVGYSWSSPKRPTLRLLIRNRHLIWRRVKEIKAVLVLLLSDLRVVWRSEIYTLMALLSSFWFHNLKPSSDLTEGKGNQSRVGAAIERLEGSLKKWDLHIDGPFIFVLVP